MCMKDYDLFALNQSMNYASWYNKYNAWMQALAISFCSLYSFLASDGDM